MRRLCRSWNHNRWYINPFEADERASELSTQSLSAKSRIARLSAREIIFLRSPSIHFLEVNIFALTRVLVCRHVRIWRIIGFLSTNLKMRLKFHDAMTHGGFIRVSFGLIANYGIRMNVTRSLTQQNFFPMEKTILRWLLFRLINRDLKLTVLHERGRFNSILQHS